MASREVVVRLRMDDKETVAKFQSLRKEQSQLEIDFAATKKAIRDNAKELIGLNQAYAKGAIDSKQLAAQTAVNRTQFTALTKTLADQDVRLTSVRAQTREYRNDLGGLTDAGLRFRDKMAASFKGALGSLATQYIGVGAAVYGLQKIVGGAIDTVVEFDKKLANVSALGGEYRASIEALGESAKTIGPKFGVGAGQALDSVEALAKAGVSAADILSGALEAALTLAASGELEAGQAAEYLSSTLVQYQLSGKDAAHVSDLLSAAANKAQGDVSDFGNALKFVGPVAASMNISLDETVGTLADFANNGILGEQAGTSLRGVLSSLTSPSKAASDELERLGVVTEEGGNKLFDAQGKFKGLANLAGVLQEATKNLTQEERANALGKIFGNQQLTAANILIKEGEKGIRDFTTAVNDQGIAVRIAAEKLDSISGRTDKATAAWEGFILSIDKGDGVISQTIKGALDSFTELFSYISAQTAKNAREDIFGAKAQKFFDAAAGANARGQNIGDSKVLDRYNEQIASIEKEADATTKAERALSLYQDALQHVQDLQAKQANGGLDVAGTIDLAGAQAAASEAARIAKEAADSTKAAAGTSTAAIKEETDAIETNSEAKTNAAKVTLNAIGSIAAYNAEIAALRKAQDQSTTSEQFKVYEVQIDALTEKVQYLTGELVKMPALKDVKFTATGTDTGPIQAPPAQEKVSQLADLEEQQRINEIKRITDYNLQRQILNEQYNEGVIQSKEELNARLQVLADDEAQQQAQRDANTAAATAQLFDTLQAISDQSFDKKIADVDSQEQTLKDKLANAQSEQEKAEIQGQIDRLENEKKSLEKRKASFKTFAIASSLISTYLAAAQVMADPTNFTPVGKIIAVAGIVAAGLANVAKIAGFAKGGEVPDERGTVTSSWGKPIRRSNGDDVLVTLKRKEKVLNAEQIARAEAIAGKGFWGRIGLPNHPTYASTTAFLTDQQAPRKQRIAGYAIGGTVGYIASPTVAELSTERNVAELRAINFQPVVSVVEINKVQNRTRVAESLSTA